jgi:hypothetical protein
MNKNTMKTQTLKSLANCSVHIPSSFFIVSVKTVITDPEHLPLTCLFLPVSGWNVAAIHLLAMFFSHRTEVKVFIHILKMYFYDLE